MRKLATIMFTDIVGYTALTASDEEKAFQLLNTQRELLKPIVEEFGGSWLKEIGDGLLLTFPTVSDANRLEDREARERFLTNVRENREVVAAWDKAQL